MYCEAVTPQLGTPHCGWRGSGGILFDAEGHLRPQHNAQAITQRIAAPYVPEHVKILVPPFSEKPFSPHNSPLFSNTSHKLFGSNLLACKREEEDSEMIRLWTASKLDGQSAVTGYIATVEDGETLDVSFKCEEESHFPLLNEPLELRAAEFSNERLWARTAQGLHLLCPNSHEAQSIFSDPVKVFQESPLIPDELCLLDENGEIWHGSFDSLSKCTENGENTRSLVYTDHPRVLATASTTQVSTFDVRDENSNLLFELPEFRQKLEDEADYVPHACGSRSEIRHLYRSSSHPNYLFVASHHHLHVLDVRYPGRDLLSFNHFIPSGGHLLYSSHTTSPQSILSLFVVDYLNSDLWSTHLTTPTMDLCSSIGPLSVMWEASSQAGNAPAFTGMSVLPQVKQLAANSVDVCFASRADGSIAYKTLIHGDLTEREKKELASSFGQLPNRQKRDRKDADQVCSLISINGLGPLKGTIPSEPVHPFQRRRNVNCQPLPLLQVTHPDALLSKGITTLWNSFGS